MNEEMQIIIKQWTQENWKVGKLFGFPDCCVKEFCDFPPELMQASTPTINDIIKFRAGCVNEKFTGFIPCLDHAKQIQAGKITLASLITDRDPFLPPFLPVPDKGNYGPEIDITGHKIIIEK